jgi:hypothetical protein
VIAEPPLLAGGLQDTVAEDRAKTAVTRKGGLDTDTAVTGSECALTAPVPARLDALTVKVYVVPLVSPETTHVNAPVVVQPRPPGDATTEYRVMVAPPLSTGAVQLTDIEPAPVIDPMTDVGASGAEAGTTAPAPPPGRLSPTAFVARTVNV